MVLVSLCQLLFFFFIYLSFLSFLPYIQVCVQMTAMARSKDIRILRVNARGKIGIPLAVMSAKFHLVLMLRFVVGIS